MIGGGATVVMSLLYLGRMLGYKKFHLFGVDSSYNEGEHHAYNQSANDGERIIEVIVHGQRFMCAPWMVGQAKDFQEQARRLVEQGCDITVHGSGLIPFIAQHMGN
jgi:hypothetical protein